MLCFSIDKGNKQNNAEQLNNELTNAQKTLENHKSEARELQTKIDEASHALALSQKEYEKVHQTKEQLLQGLTPEQVSSVTSGGSWREGTRFLARGL